MEKMKSRLIFALALAAMATGTAKGQTWTVIHLPETIDELPAAVEEQLGMPLDSVPNRNLTHIKFTGMDLQQRGLSTYSRNSNVYKLVQKAKVIDLSELTENPENDGYWANYDGRWALLTAIGSSLDSLQKMIYPRVARVVNQNLSYCRQLTEVVWPDAPSSLAEGMFRECVSLQRIQLPDGLRSVPNACFDDCTSLTEVVLPDGLTAIGNGAFEDCVLLKAVQLPASVTTLGNGVFYRCTSLRSMVLPEGVDALHDNLFGGCDSLTSVSIPTTVRSMDNYVFEYCRSLEHIDLPAGLTTIGRGAFGHSGLRSAVVPNTVTTMGIETFYGCDSLISVTLPTGLGEVPDGTFRGCSSLVHVDMPFRPKRIGESAFRELPLLEQIELPEGLEDIDNYAFQYAYLTSVKLPNTLKRLGSAAFGDADRLKTIDIPASMQIIGESAFASCDSLQDVTLHEGLLMIKDGAFRNSPMVGTVELPNTLRFLGRSVFSGNTRRASFTLPPLLTEVPDGTCGYCDSLRVIVLHPGTTRIGSEAFAGGGYWHTAHLSHIDLPEGLVTIGSFAFDGQPLEEINIPSTVREIGRYAYNGGKYRRVVLPEGVEKIGERCFRSDSLKYADFPSTVRCLGGVPLGDGPRLDSIVVRAAIPPLYASWGYTERHSTFYVPELSVDLYKASVSFNYVDSIAPLQGYQPGTLIVDQAFSTDSELYKYGTEKRNLILTLTGENKTEIGRLYVAPQTTMNLGRYRYDYKWWTWYWVNQLPTLIPDGTMTADEMEMNYYCNDLNFWQSLTAPFDMHRSDITCDNTLAPYSIRVWDGKARANGNHSKVWRDVAADELIPAGTPFILFSGYYPAEKSYGSTLNDIVRGWDESCTLHFRSQQPHNATVFQTDDVTIPLPEYKAEFAHNAGWSMVGNPWQCYFDIQQLDGDAPILILDQGDKWRQFRAVSPIDDELILRPLQSFLVQRSDQQQTVTFKTAGRQDDDAIHHETAARQNSPAQHRRAQLRAARVRYDATLSLQTEQGDSVVAQTRVVLNPKATKAYDRGLDAPYMTMDEGLTGLYSLTDGLRYSINEQPFSTVSVSLGMQFEKPGTYTLSINTTADSPALLIDHETGFRTEANEPYTFMVERAGTQNQRFTIQMSDGVQSVTSVTAEPQQAGLYDLQGRRVSTPAKGLYIRNGKKVIK